MSSQTFAIEEVSILDRYKLIGVISEDTESDSGVAIISDRVTHKNTSVKTGTTFANWSVKEIKDQMVVFADGHKEASLSFDSFFSSPVEEKKELSLEDEIAKLDIQPVTLDPVDQLETQKLLQKELDFLKQLSDEIAAEKVSASNFDDEAWDTEVDLEPAIPVEDEGQWMSLYDNELGMPEEETFEEPLSDDIFDGIENLPDDSEEVRLEVRQLLDEQWAPAADLR